MRRELAFGSAAAAPFLRHRVAVFGEELIVTAEVDQPAAVSAPALDQVVDEVVQVVQNKRAAPMDVAEVRELVEQEWARYDDAPVRTYLPVLVQRAVVGDLLGRD